VGEAVQRTGRTREMRSFLQRKKKTHYEKKKSVREGETTIEERGHHKRGQLTVVVGQKRTGEKRSLGEKWVTWETATKIPTAAAGKKGHKKGREDFLRSDFA